MWVKGMLLLLRTLHYNIKNGKDHIQLHTEQDEQMDKVIELLEEIKRNTDIIGREE